MRHYEVVFMVHPDQSEQVPGMVDRYKEMLVNDGGRVHRIEDWGRRQLAYEIKGVHKAHYVLMNIECGQASLDELKRLFKFNDVIIRHLILSQPDAITSQSAMLRKPDERERREERY